MSGETLTAKVARLEHENEQLRAQLDRHDHPTRKRILLWLADHGPGSPIQYSSDPAHPETLGSASYHFRVLLSRGQIRQTRSRPVRGATEHFYALKGRRPSWNR